MNAYAVDDWDELEAAYFGKKTGTYDSVPFPAYSHAKTSGYNNAAQSIPDQVPVRSIPSRRPNRKQVQHQYRMEIIAEHKSKERYISGKRFKEVVLVTLAIMISASMFAFLLYRQSQITSLNFQNNAMQKQITLLEQETSQIQVEMIANADLTQIRWDAMEKLAMQEPSAKQMMVVKLPLADRLVTNASSISSVSSKASLAIAKANLAQYYSSFK